MSEVRSWPKPFRGMLRRCREAKRQWLQALLSLVGIGALVLYITHYSSELHRLREFSAGRIGLLCLVVLVGHVSYILRFRLSAALFGVTLTPSEAFSVVEFGSLINIVPFSAMGFRALYLKKVHSLPYAGFGMGALVILLTGFAASGALGLPAVWRWMSVSGVGVPWPLVILFAAYFAGPLVVWWISRRVGPLRPPDAAPPSGRRWLDLLGPVRDSLHAGCLIIRSRPRIVMQLVGLNVVTSIVVGVRFWLVGMWLGYPVDPAGGIILQGVAQLTSIVAIIPSGTVGLREAITGLGAAGLGGAALQGVMISTIDRVVETSIVVVLGGLSLWLLRGVFASAPTPGGPVTKDGSEPAHPGEDVSRRALH